MRGSVTFAVHLYSIRKYLVMGTGSPLKEPIVEEEGEGIAWTFWQSTHEHVLLQGTSASKHSQYFFRHMLFLHLQPLLWECLSTWRWRLVVANGKVKKIFRDRDIIEHPMDLTDSPIKILNRKLQDFCPGSSGSLRLVQIHYRRCSRTRCSDKIHYRFLRHWSTDSNWSVQKCKM